MLKNKKISILLLLLCIGVIFSGCIKKQVEVKNPPTNGEQNDKNITQDENKTEEEIDTSDRLTYKNEKHKYELKYSPKIIDYINSEEYAIPKENADRIVVKSNSSIMHLDIFENSKNLSLIDFIEENIEIKNNSNNILFNDIKKIIKYSNLNKIKTIEFTTNKRCCLKNFKVLNSSYKFIYLKNNKSKIIRIGYPIIYEDQFSGVISTFKFID